MKVIINGDDFGATKSISEGIIKAMKEGVLSDTTAMVTTPFFEESIEMAKENGINEMGIHLSLTCGTPLLEKECIKGILTEDNKFPRKPNANYINLCDAEKELRAQINKFLATGMKLNHIDSHHHFYMYNKGYLDLVIKLSKEFNVPIRCLSSEAVDKSEDEYGFDKRDYDSIAYVRKNNIKCPDFVNLDFYDTGATEESLINILKDSIGKYEVIEIMSHPSKVDDDLRKLSSYNEIRGKELEILTSPRVKKFIDENNIELISYSVL